VYIQFSAFRGACQCSDGWGALCLAAFNQGDATLGSEGGTGATHSTQWTDDPFNDEWAPLLHKHQPGYCSLAVGPSSLHLMRVLPQGLSSPTPNPEMVGNTFGRQQELAPVRERLLIDDDECHFEPVPWCVGTATRVARARSARRVRNAPVACRHRVPRAVPRSHAGYGEHRLCASLALVGRSRKIPERPAASLALLAASMAPWGCPCAAGGGVEWERHIRTSGDTTDVRTTSDPSRLTRGAVQPAPAGG